MSERKYLPSLGDLIDRLSIDQIKELLIPEAKQQYAQEIQDILHDLDLIFKRREEPDGFFMSASVIRAIVVLAQMNLHIWKNESECRAGTGKGNLALTHGLNGLRVQAKNKINEELQGGSIDYKVDCLAADFKDWQVSW